MTLLEVLNATASGSRSQYQAGNLTLSTPAGSKESVFVSVSDKYSRKLIVFNMNDFRVITENDISKLISIESLLLSYNDLIWEEVTYQEEALNHVES